ncbi:hypothetical protein GCM10011342_28950 [Aquisalinus flavus]|uniref:Peptidase M61 catalytic domain-containing protein n=1 Tax=Aquisalinus flavus TaxID=1526572 RepID=A0A8J2V624_9PROT|nr:hypothetical protein [Aquisalinus flavus]MBD0428125.1 hypothetical protein [Aquisalinus flavus]GGD18494.1 hypothetical protein GCM10011342_28950 [Aquisalinus flavus]
MRKIVFGAVCAMGVLAGCSTELDRRQAFIPDTELQMVDADTMRVTYRLDRPAPGLAFRRVTDGQRAERWVPLDEGFVLNHGGDRDYVQRKDGDLFTEIAFDIPATFIRLPQDYSPFMPYRDGGLLIHSGRFQACVRSCGIVEQGTVFPMQLIPGEGQHIILDGEVLDGPVRWDDVDDGTMVYLGAAEPIETDYVVAVVDQALPADLSTALDDLFPALMAYYTERLGALESKPMLFAALDRHTEADGNPDSNNYSNQGGVLPNQVFMHMSGDGWLETAQVRGPQITGFVAKFFAHEAAHLFQTGSGAAFSTNDAWIHEGGAEALALVALRELSAAPDDYLRQWQEQAVDNCLLGLADGGLRSATERDVFNLHYECGMIIQLSADQEIRREGKGDIFTIWRAFRGRIADGEPWNEDTFLSVIEAEAGRETRELAGDILSGSEMVTRARLLAAIGI